MVMISVFTNIYCADDGKVSSAPISAAPTILGFLAGQKRKACCPTDSELALVVYRGYSASRVDGIATGVTSGSGALHRIAGSIDVASSTSVAARALSRVDGAKGIRDVDPARVAALARGRAQRAALAAQRKAVCDSGSDSDSDSDNGIVLQNSSKGRARERSLVLVAEDEEKIRRERDAQKSSDKEVLQLIAALSLVGLPLEGPAIAATTRDDTARGAARGGAGCGICVDSSIAMEVPAFDLSSSGGK
jgi:hypothetical protein